MTEDLFKSIDLDAEDYLLETLNVNYFSQTRRGIYCNSKKDAESSEQKSVREAVSKHYQDLVLFSNAAALLTVECNRYAKKNESNPATKAPKSKYSLPLPVTIPVKELLQTENISIDSIEQRQQKLKQLNKDVVRDRLLINNHRITGAIDGLQGVKSLIEQEINSMLLDLHFPILPKEISSMLTEATLLKASRTNSGANVIQSLMTLIDPQYIVLIPQSSIVPPIQILIQLGSCPSNTQDWGIVCRIKCDFMYLLSGDEQLDNSNSSSESANSTESASSSEYLFSKEFVNKTVKVSYEDAVFMKVEIVKNSVEDYDLFDDSDTGTVTFNHYP